MDRSSDSVMLGKFALPLRIKEFDLILFVLPPIVVFPLLILEQQTNVVIFSSIFLLPSKSR